MKSVNIRIINQSAFELPQYATQDASGVDLRANLDSEVHLQPFERLLIPTGLFLEIPSGYEAQVRPRSGLAIKNGLTCLNSPGTIDADYRGEVKVILINLSNQTQTIRPGDRIAQMVFQSVVKANFENVSIINTTQRGEGGFGHTGVES